jgi:hypothetical protein
MLDDPFVRRHLLDHFDFEELGLGPHFGGASAAVVPAPAVAAGRHAELLALALVLVAFDLLHFAHATAYLSNARLATAMIAAE